MALFSTTLWGTTETVTKTKDNWTGVSCALTNSECANGSADAKKDGDASNVTYIKFRTNKNGNTMTFTVNEGYKITGFSIRGYSNDDSKAVELVSVKYDSGTPIAINQSFPAGTSKTEGTTYTYSNTTDEATSSLVLSFGTNAGTQIMAVITITYEELEEDTDAPTLSSSNPANNATDVPTSGTIVLTFSEAIASVDGTKFSLSEGATKGTVAIDGSDAKKVNVPYSGASYNTIVTLSVAADAVADAAGNKSAALSNISFTTLSGPVAVTGITITPTSPEVTVGSTVALSAAVSPDNATDKTVTWSVQSGDTYAEVSPTGVVTGLAEGTATIRATANDGSGVYAEKEITVGAALPACYTFTATLPEDTTIYDVDDVVANAGSGGEMVVKGNTVKNTPYGLSFESSGTAKVEVTLGSLMKVGTIIKATLWSNNTGSARSLKLNNSGSTTKATWSFTPASASGEDKEFSYTVVAGDGLEGSNVFQLQRGTNVCLKSLTVSNCGAELYELSSAVDPADEATVTLSATQVAEGATATATYSDIDPLKYEFDEWVISGTGASIDDAKANPVTITMGSENATITLKLKEASVKYYVHFDSKGGSAVADQLVVKGEHAAVPTAPTKFKYTFGGWSETDGGSTPADLSAIAITAEKTFYAIWTPIDCPTSGTIFSLVSDGSKAPTSNTYYPSTKPGIADLSTYATVSGGIAQSVHTTTSNNPVQIQASTSGMKIVSDDGYIRVLLECPLQEGDTIKFVKDNKIKITFDSLKTAAKTVQLASGTGANKDYYVVAAGFAGEDTIHVRKDGSNVTVTSVKVIRPNGSATALDDTADVTKAVKFFEKGQLYIRRGEKVYTITGELVK